MHLLVPSAFVLLDLCLIISSMWCWYLLSLIYVPTGDSFYSYFFFCLPAFFLEPAGQFCILITHSVVGVNCLILK